MPSETHEEIIKETISKLINEGWICSPSYTFNNFFYDILAFNPKTNETKAFEIQMNGQPKDKYLDSPFPIEYIFPKQKAKSPKELEYLSMKFISALSSPIRLNLLLAIEEQPRHFCELSSFVTEKKHKSPSGLSAYHIRKLVISNLVERNQGIYVITSFGEETLKFLRSIKNNDSIKKLTIWKSNLKKEGFNYKKQVNPNSRRQRVKKILLDNPSKKYSYKDLTRIFNEPIGIIAPTVGQLGLIDRINKNKKPIT